MTTNASVTRAKIRRGRADEPGARCRPFADLTILASKTLLFRPLFRPNRLRTLAEEQQSKQLHFMLLAR